MNMNNSAIISDDDNNNKTADNDMQKTLTHEYISIIYMFTHTRYKIWRRKKRNTDIPMLCNGLNKHLKQRNRGEEVNAPNDDVATE